MIPGGWTVNKLRVGFLTGVLAAFGILLSPPLFSSSAELSKMTISARVLSVAPDQSTAVINRGKGENVIPGSVCIIRPNRGENQADIEWDIYFAKGVVQSVADGSSVIKLTALYEKIEPRDYCTVEANIPAGLADSDLGRIALYDIAFLDLARKSPLFTLADMIKDPSPKAADALYDKLLREILAIPPSAIDERFVKGRIKGGLFNGLTFQEVFRTTTRQHIEKFVENKAWFAGRLIGYDWLLVDAYANWVFAETPSGESEKKSHRAEPIITRGDNWLAKGGFQEALAEYNKALLTDPENEEAKKKIETVNTVLERQKVLEDDEKDVTTRHALGLDLFSLRLYAGALEQFQKAKDLGDETDELNRYLAFSHAALNHFGEARAVLEPIALRLPQDAEIKKWLDFVRQNEILAKQGPNVSSFLAIGEIKYAEGHYGDAIAQYNQALEIEPKNTEIWRLIANSAVRRRARQQELWAQDYWQKGQFNDARACWKTALELCQIIHGKESQKAILSDMASSMYGSSFYDEAVQTYRTILALDPDDSASCFEIARCDIEKKDYPEAIRWAENGLAKNPKDSWGYAILGAVHEDAGNIDQAVANYQKAVDILPSYKDPVYNLGRLSALKGEYEKAEEFFRRALEIDVGYWDARNRLMEIECVLEAQALLQAAPADNEARFRLASALSSLGDYDRAIVQLKDLLKSPRDAARALEGLGHCLIWQEKYQEGLASLEDSYRLDPKPNLKAWILYGEARLLLLKNPNDPAAVIKLGEDSLYWERYDEALSHFEKARNLGAEPDAVFVKMEVARKGKEARKQIGLSSDFYNRAQYEKAVECGESALSLYREVGARRGEMNALLRIGWSQAAMFKHEDALRSYHLAGQTAEALKDEKAEAQYLDSLGNYYAGFGDYEKALEYQERTRKLWHENNALLDEAGAALPAIGWLKFRLGDFGGELECYERALAIHRKLSYPQGEAAVLINMATAYDREGDFSKAIESYQRALTIAQKYAIKTSVLSAYLGLGSIYESLGDIENARKYYQRCLDTAVALGIRSERANALNMLGLLHLEKTKDYGKALEFFEESLSLSHLLGDRLTEGVAASNIAVVHSRQGNFREALAQHEEAMRIFGTFKNKYLEMQGMNEEGEMYLGLKEYDRALDCQLKARELAQFFGTRSEQWAYELAAGKICETKGEIPNAVDYYKKAAETLKGIKNRITDEKLRKGFGEQDKQTEVYKRLIGLLMKSGQTEEAFRFIEESKSKIVKDAFGDVKPAAADADLKQTLSGVDKMEKKKEALERELREEKKKPEEARDAKKMEILSKTLATTEGEFNQWMIKLKFQNRKIYDALSIKPTELADVQRQIPAGAVFLEYFISPEELYVFCIGREFFLARSTAITEADLTTLVNRFVRLCQEPPSGGIEKLFTLGEQLYQVLVAPVDDIIERYETVVIVPFGVLYYLPFHALVKETAGKPEYLIERKRICYTTSATFADILKNASRGNKSFMAFGNPDGSLPAATEEMRTLEEKIFKANGKIFSAQAATKDAFLKQAKDVNILHLATHGVLESNPLDSYLLFAGPDKESQELTLLEVAGYTALREKNSLVFLSACQTAKEAGKAGTGSELITLAEAFAMAGAPTLIATLWQVEDNSTRLFALTFYDELMNKKKDKLDAMRAGQIALIRSEEYRHPFFWASFLMIGSWR